MHWVIFSHVGEPNYNYHDHAVMSNRYFFVAHGLIGLAQINYEYILHSRLYYYILKLIFYIHIVMDAAFHGGPPTKSRNLIYMPVLLWSSFQHCS